MTEGPALRIALVGFGPRGFGCLERLAIEAARRDPGSAPVHVTAHDPRAHPGAGLPYDPDQPDGMLLNFSARHVDAWSEDNDLLSPSDRPGFVEWLGRFHPEWAAGAGFVPRRLFGAYLRDCTERLIAALPATMRFRHVQGEVVDLELVTGGWSVRHADPALDMERVDEVMVATGHGTGDRDRAFERWDRELPFAPSTLRIPSVYPVAHRLRPEAVPGGSTVGVRGFALTWIDAVLSVTEGRGGRFEEEAGPIPRYHGSAGPEPRVAPFSRTGLPLLAKSGPELDRRSEELSSIWDTLRRSIRRADRLTPAGLEKRLNRAAARALEALGAGSAVPAIPSSALHAMERSVRIAAGDLPPDLAWARGEAWRRAYPAVVDRAGDGGITAAWPAGFSRLARTMERIAFGPPPGNLARMVSIARAGHLDLRFVRHPGIRASQGCLVLESGGASLRLDALVNAVLPPPGVHPDTPLLYRLLRRGHVCLAPVWHGIVVTDSAGSIGPDGMPVPGLSVVGRATEGWVLGNDTLNRTLHGHTRRWARRVLEPALQAATGAVP